MKDFFQSLIDSSQERIKSPFIGSYITSFLIYNWRPIFILLFSDAKMECKIEIINKNYCMLSALLWPLGITAFYILILPYLNIFFDWLLEKANNAKKGRQKNIKVDILQQKIIEAQLQRKIADERAGTSEVGSLQQKIIVLEKENEIKSQEIVDTISRNNNELTNLKSRYDQICLEKENKEVDYKNLLSNFSTATEINSLLVNPNNTADRDIKIYFRKNLSKNEVSALRRQAEEKNSSYSNLPLDMTMNALLLKANIYRLDEVKNMYVMTAEGRKFVYDID